MNGTVFTYGLHLLQFILGLPSGFPRRLENLENENGHGKVMENWPKVMEFCDSDTEFYQFYLQFGLNLYILGHH